MAIAAKYIEANPYLTDRQRLIPPLYFNLGRIVSYTLLGRCDWSPRRCADTLASRQRRSHAARFDTDDNVGLNMLGLLPNVAATSPLYRPRFRIGCTMRPPMRTKAAAFLLGAATSFFPAASTQALQLYVLSKASFTVGALTHACFCARTLPRTSLAFQRVQLGKGAFRGISCGCAGAAYHARHLQYPVWAVLTVAARAVWPMPSRALLPQKSNPAEPYSA